MKTIPQPTQPINVCNIIMYRGLGILLVNCIPDKVILDGSVLSGLFDEYLQSQGNWLRSSLVVRLKKNATTEALGEEAMVPFRDLKEQYGLSVAKQMRHQKRQLQSKAKNGDPPFVMDHPDMPGCEVPQLD